METDSSPGPGGTNKLFMPEIVNIFFEAFIFCATPPEKTKLLILYFL